MELVMGFSLESTTGWWKLSISKLVILLLPIAWRKPKTVAYIQSLMSPLQQMHYHFVKNRDYNIYRVNHNFQKCYLETALNDEFDPQERRIRVEEDMIVDSNYIYTSGEQIPKYLGVKYLYPSTSYTSNVDFIVNMNQAKADVFDIRSLVDFYKLFGTRYKIINNYNLISNQNG
ncbi:MAG: hypothetical protein WCY77_10315 [Weeksellaceae bacterium]